jgi:Bacterial Ig-like domain (group 1)
VPDMRRPGGPRYRGAIATLLVVAAFGALLSIPAGNWGGASASAAYYYYNPGSGPAILELSPVATTNTVGTSHTVTATVTQDGNPVGNVTVRFTVTGSVATSGTCTTGSSGQCTFTYTGPSLPGADLISAFADLNGNGTRDADEPAATATKAWILPTSTPGQVTGGGQIVTGTDRVTFGFNAKSTSAGLKGECTVVDHDTKRLIKCLDVTALVQSGNEATIYGHAMDDGVSTTYVIHVADNADSGRGADTFSITTTSGYAASGTLTSGNIQTH